MAKNQLHITNGESPEAWVLHRLLGHHPTSPNLRLAGITAQTPNLRDRIEGMIAHDTYRSRIASIGFAHILAYQLADDAELIVRSSATPEPVFCPYCSKPYEQPEEPPE